MEAFLKVLKSPKEFEAFRTYMCREFAIENLYFWSIVEKYRVEEPSKAAAIEIYEKFIEPDSEFSVNLSWVRQGEVRRRYLMVLDDDEESVDLRTMFDDAQQDIFNLMLFDSFRRYSYKHEKLKPVNVRV